MVESYLSIGLVETRVYFRSSHGDPAFPRLSTHPEKIGLEPLECLNALYRSEVERINEQK